MNREVWQSRCHVLAVAAVVLLAASSAGAQDPVRPYRNVFTVNPLGIPFEYFSAEYERAAGLASFGITGSYLNVEGTYSTVEGKVRFYPNEDAPKGFSIGLAGGLTRITDESYNSSTNETEERTESFPTIAVIVDYNWLIGKTKRFLVGVGVGGKRFLGGNDDEFLNINVAYPTARFQIGLMF